MMRCSPDSRACPAPNGLVFGAWEAGDRDSSDGVETEGVEPRPRAGVDLGDSGVERPEPELAETDDDRGRRRHDGREAKRLHTPMLAVLPDNRSIRADDSRIRGHDPVLAAPLGVVQPPVCVAEQILGPRRCGK